MAQRRGNMEILMPELYQTEPSVTQHILGMLRDQGNLINEMRTKMNEMRAQQNAIGNNQEEQAENGNNNNHD